ncbi:MAG: histidinol dehydrogenase [Leptospirales bacterium]|nr:histidinol dehydrogenase [Leptospirales bacterium]
MLRIYRDSELSIADRQQLMQRASMADQAAVQRVEAIVDGVLQRGAAAVREFAEEFDGGAPETLLLDATQIASGGQQLSAELREAFGQAYQNIKRYHQMQREALRDQEQEIDGARLGFRYQPVESAGIYVPGGRARYPSSVLMGVTPAQLAGVQRIVVITPAASDGAVDPAVLYCASLAGATELLRVGGAHGIAAAAAGVGGRRVRVISGPGNRYVTAAKALLAARGLVRIDMPAGPSEVVVVADRSARPEFVAADLLSQAEHGEDSPAVLLTDSSELAQEVDRAIQRGLEQRPQRRAMKERSIREHSFAVVFASIDRALEFANEYAAEHLELCTSDPEGDLQRVHNAGSIFVGHYAPVALGDYYSGTNHVLPTGGAAHAYSGLGVEFYMKRLSYQIPTKESLRRALDPILKMSAHEGFDQEHGNSVAVRFR